MTLRFFLFYGQGSQSITPLQNLKVRVNLEVFDLRVAKSTPGSTGGEKELIARRKVDKKKPPD